MCRHLAYLGPGVTLSGLFYEAPHSLEHQSYAAQQMLEGHVNADGFGVAWYPPTTAKGQDSAVTGDPKQPLSYRSARPAWGDANWSALARRMVGRIALMNVRNATDPSTTALGSIHPFTSSRWSLTHNGYLTGFREHFLRELGSRLSDERYKMRQGASDTETMFLLLLDHLEAGEDPHDALAGLVHTAASLAREAEQPSFLNFLLSDGEKVWATRAGTAPRQPSLYVAHDLDRFPDASLVASEPLDEDKAWTPVPESHLVVLEGGTKPVIQALSI